MEKTTKKPTRRSRMSLSLLSLPTHLIQEILSRLPPRALFICKAACKQLLRLVSDPEFAHLHLSRSRPHLLYHYSLDSFSLIEFHADKPPAILRVPAIGYDIINATLLNSCNGVLCLYMGRGHHAKFAVCNPILRQFIILPVLTNCFIACLVAIGFCPREKQLKVLCVVRPRGKKFGVLEARIYTIGNAAGSWRTIGPAPPSSYNASDLFASSKWIDTFVNGSAHWLGHERRGSPPTLHAFDFDTEKFRVLPLSEKMDIRPWMQVGVFEGCLVVSSVSDLILPHQADVWIMKEYGVKESWTKLYSVVDQLASTDTPKRIVQPFKVLDGDGAALVMPSTMRFVSYDVKNSSLRHLKGIPLEPRRERVAAVSLTPSLVSLRRIVNQERVYVY